MLAQGYIISPGAAKWSIVDQSFRYQIIDDIYKPEF